MPVKSFLTLVVLLTIVAVLFIQLASMPGEIAKRRGHPQAKAIGLLGWIGLPIGIAPWVVALIWAQLDPFVGVKDIDKRDKDEGTAENEQTASP